MEVSHRRNYTNFSFLYQRALLFDFPRRYFEIEINISFPCPEKINFHRGARERNFPLWYCAGGMLSRFLLSSLLSSFFLSYFAWIAWKLFKAIFSCIRASIALNTVTTSRWHFPCKFFFDGIHFAPVRFPRFRFECSSRPRNFEKCIRIMRDEVASTPTSIVLRAETRNDGKSIFLVRRAGNIIPPWKITIENSAQL